MLIFKKEIQSVVCSQVKESRFYFLRGFNIIITIIIMTMTISYKDDIIMFHQIKLR